jgi:hypothetical protein
VADGQNNRLRLISFGPPSLLQFAPGSMLFTNQITVALTTPVTNGVIRYTLDGSVPAMNSAVYSNSLSITQATTIQAVVFVNEYVVSLPAQASYQRVYAFDDAIPVSWREQYFGTNYLTNPLAANDADPDNDGASNLAEYLAGTNPLIADSVLRVANVSATPGLPVTVPIEILANGTENAISFSLNFNPGKLTYVCSERGSNVTAFFPSESQVVNGRLGLALALPAGQTFAVGTQEIARITFLPTFSPTNVTVPVTFGDQPVIRQLADVQAILLSATYSNGIVSIPAADYEGDISPRGNTDRRVTVIDWVLIGRFIAALDAPTNELEFQRADCAPLSMRGNGLLTVIDWVQAGRFAAGLDPLVVAGGPTNPIIVPNLIRQSIPPRNLSGAGAVAVVESCLRAGQTDRLTVTLTAQGTENALAFSLNFDPTQMTFVSAALANPAAGTVLNVNDQQAAAGKLGIAVALPAGNNFAAGAQQIVALNFAVATTAGNRANLTFGDAPVRREISDSTANVVEAAWQGKTLVIIPAGGLPPLQVKISAGPAGKALILDWPAGMPDLVVEGTETLTAPVWKALELTPAQNGANCTVTIPVQRGQQFFRLRAP